MKADYEQIKAFKDILKGLPDHQFKAIAQECENAQRAAQISINAIRIEQKRRGNQPNRND